MELVKKRERFIIKFELVDIRCNVGWLSISLYDPSTPNSSKTLELF